MLLERGRERGLERQSERERGGNGEGREGQRIERALFCC